MPLSALLGSLVSFKPHLNEPADCLGLYWDVRLFAAPRVNLVHEGFAHAHLKGAGRIRIGHVRNVDHSLTSVKA